MSRNPAEEPKLRNMGKSELKRLIAARLRDRKTPNTAFVQLANLLLDLKHPGALPEKDLAKATQVATQPTVDDVVRELESDAQTKL